MSLSFYFPKTRNDNLFRCAFLVVARCFTWKFKWLLVVVFFILFSFLKRQQFCLHIFDCIALNWRDVLKKKRWCQLHDKKVRDECADLYKQINLYADLIILFKHSHLETWHTLHPSAREMEFPFRTRLAVRIVFYVKNRMEHKETIFVCGALFNEISIDHLNVHSTFACSFTFVLLYFNKGLTIFFSIREIFVFDYLWANYIFHNFRWKVLQKMCPKTRLRLVMLRVSKC